MSNAPGKPTDATFSLNRTMVKAFLENVPDIVFFKDRESRFIAVSRSKAERHELQPDDLRGKSDSDFFSPQHARWARADEENIMATGEPVIEKLERTYWLDGREGWSEVTKLPLRDDTGNIIGTFGLSKDITEAQQMALALEKANRDIVDASRLAGMAEVATGVLHNVGNVLTSLNVSANVIATSLHQTKTASLAKVSALLDSHAADLAEFADSDPKGRLIPGFIESLAQHWVEEQERLLEEISSLQRNVDHIKEIVAMQQTYATMAGVVESLEPVALMEDALRMNAGALVRLDVSVVRDFQPTAAVQAQKAKILQILVNLIRNAKHAADEGDCLQKVITVRVIPAAGDGFVRLVVEDNGIGIAPEQLPSLFKHGYTTRAQGHGFGLHSAAIAAEEMQGSLTAYSAGLGTGAIFTLELPIAPVSA